MTGHRLRALRESAGLSQVGLAARAGVSRQLIGAVEAGRHLPRVDAALALAGALGVAAEDLFAADTEAPVAVVGQPPPPGTPVQLGRVGDRLVCTGPPRVGWRWEPADGVLGARGPTLLPGARPGTVAVGCDPALGLAAALGAQRGAPRLLTVPASTGAAVDAVVGRRAHIALVHGPEGGLPSPPEGLPAGRWHLARWEVGLAAPEDLAPGWAQAALRGRREVIQREPGASAQAAFERALAEAGAATPGGPRADGHLDAARRADADGGVAVTIAPAAAAFGLGFHPLELHTAELWVPDEWDRDPGVVALAELLASATLHRRLQAIGGYDLTGCGDRRKG